MFRLWGKLWFENRLIKDTTYLDESQRTRTQMIFRGLDEICVAFDLSSPIWLDTNIKELKKHARARFYQDSFIETIDFDFLEIQIIEEAEQ